jgi:uncharacterized membrane protein HdeD (DUF308 family)
MNRSILSDLPPGLSSLSAHWGWLLIRGISAIIFGILAFAWPRFTIASLAIVWGAYAIVDGLFALAYGIRGKTRRWAYAFLGLIGIAAGLIAMLWPNETAIILVLIIGWWAIVAGVFEIFYAIQNRRANAHPWLVGLSGLLSLVFGLFVVSHPGAGAVSLVWLIGTYAIFYGLLMIVAAIQLRRLRNQA